MADPPDPLELLAVFMMDVRATVESMRRSVTNAQSSIEQFRHIRGKSQLDDINDCLAQLIEESAVVTESVTEAKKPLSALETALKQDGDKPPAARPTERRKKRR